VKEEPRGQAWRVVLEDFVTAEDGTGIVHMAPAFGADDYAAGLRHDLPLLRPIDDAGRFDEAIAQVGGMFVKDADPVLVEDLRKRGLVYRYSLETHTYPHCWRCRSPLIYMARDSWYIRTTAVRDTMLANNAQVQWHPSEVGTGRFGEWLEGNVDWAISRERYWGTPLPIWVCDAEPDHIEVVGSFEALAARAGALPAPFDPHKPYIDDVVFPCAACSGTMRRTPEVVDVWFDSGSMPYAQWHYPFENQEQWRRHFPADFICEGVDQTRGWFYSLMAISSMLGHGPAYRHVVVNDLVLDAEGQKMSKSRGNVVDPWQAIEQFGADAIRWYFVTVSQPWVPKRFDPEALADAARRVFDTVANTYRFFALYANLENWTPEESAAPTDVLDLWLRARLASLVAQVRSDLDGYELTHAARTIGEFVIDDLSNWYVRRSRDRFWGSGDEAATRAAFATLHHALVTVAGLMAPFTPFHADWLHRALTGASVHLARFPEVDRDALDPELEAGMTAVRELARLGRAAREKVRIRVRQPLRTLHAVVPNGARVSDALLSVVKDELNVKEVRFLSGAEQLVTFRAQPNFRVLGKRFGGRTQAAAQAVRALPDATLRAFRAGAELVIELDGERHVLGAEEVELIEDAQGELIVEADAGYTVALDPAIDEGLRLEGLARELVNRTQRLRREAGLAVSDRIRLMIDGGPEIRAAAERHADYIRAETLAVELTVGPAEALWDLAQDVDLDGVPAHIALARD
jgi:isoleucyl-tRNA synthetase